MSEEALPPPDLVVHGRRVLTPQGLKPAALLLRDGKIQALREHDQAPKGARLIDAGDLVVLPGLVDTHVHVNEPGRTEWEGFETATRAAAAGGITTIVDMPLNSVPVTVTATALRAKKHAAEGKLMVDCGFWGGVIPGNAAQLEPMLEEGALGFKAFMIHSGIDEFPAASEKDLWAAMSVLARAKAPLLAHAELDHEAGAPWKDPRDYGSYLGSRPDAWEVEAIRLLAHLSRETKCRTHIVHLSSAEALPILSEARDHGAPLSAETCPHYLTFCAEEVPQGRTDFKCAPPIRSRENREKLWGAFKKGLIDLVVSDHSPCTPQLKRLESGDFQAAWGGIAGLQFSLPAAWTGASARGFTFSDLALWMSANPARFAGLSDRKGSIAPGKDADLVFFDPDAGFTVEQAQVLHKNPLTPYLGLPLKGVVEKTFVRGRLVYDRGRFPAPPKGELLLRGRL